MSNNKCILLGTGTSQGIPVIGCSCEVCQSDNPKDNRLRCSALISINNINLVIDTGPDFRQQMLREKVERVDGILLTHEHNDHIIGLDDIRPFNFMQKEAIKVYASIRVIADLKKKFEYIFAEKKYPGAPSVEIEEVGKNKFRVNEILVHPIHFQHGRIPAVGYRVGDFAYLSDIKSIDSDEMAKLSDLSNLVISALHHKEHHSHFSLSDALDFIEKINPKQAYLTHLSHKMGTYEFVSKMLPSNVSIAFDGLEIPITYI